VGTTWGNVYWPLFLGLSLCAFLAPEIYALVSSGAPNTLSQWVWIRLNVTSNERLTQWSALDFLVFCQWMVLWIWLTYHFFFHRFV
jgi:hypothetical protein